MNARKDERMAIELALEAVEAANGSPTKFQMMALRAAWDAYKTHVVQAPGPTPEPVREHETDRVNREHKNAALHRDDPFATPAKKR